jgi:hypothetical protein
MTLPETFPVATNADTSEEGSTVPFTAIAIALPTPAVIETE